MNGRNESPDTDVLDNESVDEEVNSVELLVVPVEEEAEREFRSSISSECLRFPGFSLSMYDDTLWFIA